LPSIARLCDRKQFNSMNTQLITNKEAPEANLDALDAEDKVEIIIHRDEGGVRARVHASYIAGRALKTISHGGGGALLLDAVDRCARAIYQAEGK
jgi:hypothetical protein